MHCILLGPVVGPLVAPGPRNLPWELAEGCPGPALMLAELLVATVLRAFYGSSITERPGEMGGERNLWYLSGQAWV